MLDSFIRGLAKLVFRFRYRIRIKGLEEIKEKGKRKILFLPNHPAYIDPVILYVYLHKSFQPAGFADSKQINRPVIAFFARRWGVHSLPNIVEEGSGVRAEVEKTIAAGKEDLQKDRNLIVWPAGTTAKSRYEDLGANSAVETLVKSCPDCRIVLIKTRGLWGSGFSWAPGKKPDVPRILIHAALKILANFIFFTPRREVTIELCEAYDFPREADHNTMNRYLENFYNQDAPPNLYVPYTVWEKLAGGRTKQLPDPVWERSRPDTAEVSKSTRETVADYLKEMSGVSQVNEDDDLAIDLGLDSLSRTDIVLWLEKEFGFYQTTAESIKTVGDVMLAAGGQLFYQQEKELTKPTNKWFHEKSAEKLELPVADSINQAFLLQAESQPGQVAAADQISGEKTYRQIITSCLALQPALQALKTERVGIMMPASVGALVTYLATLFAGKTPVMVNWTLGAGPAGQCLDSVNAGKVLIAKKVHDRVQAQGIDLSPLQDRFLFLEDVAAELTLGRKLKAAAAAYFNWSALRNITPAEDAVILFTSGSETIPKAVPLTHQNILANIRDVISLVNIEKRQNFIGFLPAFHSFGLTCTILIPPLCGSRVVFHANPMEARTISRIVAAYEVNILMGTPTFLKGILNAAKGTELGTLELAVTGADKCPEEVYEKIGKSCPDAALLEGYGVTECSPIVTLNDLNNPVQSSIGKVLPSFEYKLLDPESHEPVATPGHGVLVVRGPSVFRGYLNDPGKEPFVELEGKKWYHTGDLVYENENGVLFFQARLKRFVKIGGEMISLPAIESVLNSAFAEDYEEPIIAVEADESGTSPEIVLFTTLEHITREKANETIRKAGLSAIQNIRRVEMIDEIPILGTGKIDYRGLKKKLENPEH